MASDTALWPRVQPVDSDGPAEEGEGLPIPPFAAYIRLLAAMYKPAEKEPERSRVLTAEGKQKALEETQTETVVVVARRWGIKVCTLQEWRRKAGMSRKFNTWPDALRDRALELRAQGLGARRVAAEIGVPKGTVEWWLKQEGSDAC